MPTYRLTNKEYIPYYVCTLLEDNSASYSSDKVTKVTVGKAVAGSKFIFRPGSTISSSADFGNISSIKYGFMYEPYPLIVSNKAYNMGTAIYTGGSTRIGQRITLNATIVGVRLSISTNGTPPGVFYVRIRKTSDDSILVEKIGTPSDIRVSGQRSDYIFDSPITISEEVRISVEYDGGDLSNSITVWRSSTASIPGNYFSYNNVYNNDPTSSLFLEVLGVPTGGSYAAGTWTFNTKLESVTRYGFRGLMRVRISRGNFCTGEGGTLIALIEQSSSTPTIVPSTAGGQVSTQLTWDAPQIDLAPGEYMAFEFGFNITVAGGSNTSQMILVLDEDPAVGNESIVTTTWTPTSEEPVVLPNLVPRISGAVESYVDGWVRIGGALKHITDIWVRVDGTLKKI